MTIEKLETELNEQNRFGAVILRCLGSMTVNELSLPKVQFNVWHITKDSHMTNPNNSINYYAEYGNRTRIYSAYIAFLEAENLSH